MANTEHLDILKQSVETWNQWREEYPEIRPNLTAADLHGTDLTAADLGRANLHGADLAVALQPHFLITAI